jgi:hypothetical protein
MEKFEAIGWPYAVASHGYSWDNVRCYYCVQNPPMKSKGNELIRLRCVHCHSAGAHNNCVTQASRSGATKPKPWFCPMCVAKCDGAAEGRGATEGLGAPGGPGPSIGAPVEVTFSGGEVYRGAICEIKPKGRSSWKLHIRYDISVRVTCPKTLAKALCSILTHLGCP